MARRRSGTAETRICVSPPLRSGAFEDEDRLRADESPELLRDEVDAAAGVLRERHDTLDQVREEEFEGAGRSQSRPCSSSSKESASADSSPPRPVFSTLTGEVEISAYFSQRRRRYLDAAGVHVDEDFRRFPHEGPGELRILEAELEGEDLPPSLEPFGHEEESPRAAELFESGRAQADLQAIDALGPGPAGRGPNFSHVGAAVPEDLGPWASRVPRPGLRRGAARGGRDACGASSRGSGARRGIAIPDRGRPFPARKFRSRSREPSWRCAGQGRRGDGLYVLFRRVPGNVGCGGRENETGIVLPVLDDPAGELSEEGRASPLHERARVSAQEQRLGAL